MPNVQRIFVTRTRCAEKKTVKAYTEMRFLTVDGRYPSLNKQRPVGLAHTNGRVSRQNFK
jgi:hypothetical protein